MVKSELKKVGLRMTWSSSVKKTDMPQKGQIFFNSHYNSFFSVNKTNIPGGAGFF